MAEVRKKLDALLRFGAQVGPQPEVIYLVGFLAGRLDRLHFVRSLEGAPVAVRLAAGHRRVWPGSPFEAAVRGVPVPNPALLVAALCDSQDDIYVQLDLDELGDAPWFAELVAESYAELQGGGPAQVLQDRMDAVRRHIDDALDIYRECRRLLAADGGDREAQLRFFLATAEGEIEALSRQLRELNRQLTSEQQD